MSKKGASNEVNAVIQYAFERGGKDFVLTLNAENGARGVNVRGPTNDRGLCQLNKRRHRKFIESKEFQDPYKQIRYCKEVWDDAIKKKRLKTTFYGYNVRLKYIDQFIFE